MSVGIFNYFETSDSSKIFKYSVDVFADLAALIGVEELDLAYVSTTTGIFGFRNLKGLYQYKSGVWVYASKDLQDLAIAQQSEIDNNEQAITDLENTKVESVTGDGVDNTDPLNPVISNAGGNFVPLPSEGTQGNPRSIAILNSTGDDLEYTTDIKIDELSKQTFFRHGDQTSSAHEIVFRDSADQDQFIINKDKTPAYLQSLSGNDIKLNDYTFPETGDSFTLPSSDGAAGQSLITDGAGNLSFDDLQNGYTIFPIWAEDTGTLISGEFEWSFGNGAKGVNQLPIAIDCELFAFTYQSVTSVNGTTSINIIRRASGVSNLVVTTNTFTGNEGETQIFTSPFSFNATDSLIFQTNTATASPTNVRICAWFRVKATSQSNSLLGELLNVSVPTPSIGDVLSYDGTNWISSATATGSSQVATFISTLSQNVGTLSNGIGANIQITLTNILGPNAGGFTITSGNVIIQNAGWYKVSMKGVTVTTTNSRQNTGFVVKRNSVDITGTKAFGYNRNTGNAAASMSAGPVIPQFQFAQGDIIGLYAISGGDANQNSFTTSQECILTLELIQ